MIGTVDIGGTKIAVGVVSRSGPHAGTVIARFDCQTCPERGPAEGVARIVAMLRQVAAQVGESLEGIGIGCTGPVNSATGVLHRNKFLIGWEELNLSGELQNAFGVPATLENDADAAALGEAAWGAGKGTNRFIYITVSTGIGGGIVLDGRLYRGVEGAHPEIGHHVVDPSGPQCFCGARGCWESLASGTALAANAGFGTARQVCEAAGQGDLRAREAVAREGYYLGLGLANLVTLFTPEVIALGGGVMQSGHLFWDKIHATIRQTCGLVPYEKTRLVPAALDKDVVLIGAAQAWVLRYGLV